MKKLLFITLLAGLGIAAHAQSSIKRCGTHELQVEKAKTDPHYFDRVNATFNYAKQLAEDRSANRTGDDTIYRIRCVVHVVYTSAIENIPDSVIYSQIEVLNEDFRRLNADAVNTRDVFLPVAGDARIEFELAATDPDGNPTTGITRTQGTPGFLGFEPFTDNVKSGATGGKSPWPTDRYLNIWVCNVFNGFGVLGYAFPPDNAPNWPANSGADSARQGVVLHYPVVGRNFSQPIDATVTKGRSATHEIGHYLGLRHIWGDGPCGEDDGLSDTPDAADASQQTCDTTANTCTESPVDYPDMIENYMDYSDDRCLNMFTNDQIGIMRSMLQTSRAGIATRIIPTGLSQNNGAISLFEVYPNPANGVVNVKVESPSAVYSLDVFNTVGEKVASQKNNQAANAILNLNALPKGIYFVRLSTNGSTAVKKIQLL